jgi:SNF2 family DNA or RNA helicase
LRRDIEALKEVQFDYVILDESQAIKNAGALTAKCVRLLRGRNRLAMSGTPVENHLGELWSLFEFLNPGLLGAASFFDRAMARDSTSEERALLARALRPFILRRTKGQVAKDLPERQEDTIFCELPEWQRKHYDDLRQHYRQVLMKKVDDAGLNKAKIVVLEALLRLRQAACHPGLIDKAHANQPCAKLETLLPQLKEVLEEGHKALVFSQFTSFLALLRKELDGQGVVYEYLDGKTKDREALVQKFQTDPTCSLFLISLKAGGLGLNLTAAEYVFLLDPWWNPAVEAQAIDRAHRIGQTQKVMAYRLIAKDTVEEKVLALQDSKRELANAILSEDNAILRNLTRDDLEFLLG